MDVEITIHGRSVHALMLWHVNVALSIWGLKPMTPTIGLPSLACNGVLSEALEILARATSRWRSIIRELVSDMSGAASFALQYFQLLAVETYLPRPPGTSRHEDLHIVSHVPDYVIVDKNSIVEPLLTR